ncbi:hypothetical protein Q361_1014 [Flavobacterium croceum DSM 17960]|uniref:Uncharacterized protein n=1 Tax=Flavobacterium croceum DSM 17960 TaxID=1121886 RepID=A0A2S4NB20_9FLAO|nr:hypothetical protein [Flavobacterium croceum]POS02906.1 hypothetical protein Q361_1014 [Flavobacterium croceum DSM 17960]
MEKLIYILIALLFFNANSQNRYLLITKESEFNREIENKKLEVYIVELDSLNNPIDAEYPILYDAISEYQVITCKNESKVFLNTGNTFDNDSIIKYRKSVLKEALQKKRRLATIKLNIANKRKSKGKIKIYYTQLYGDLCKGELTSRDSELLNNYKKVYLFYNKGLIVIDKELPENKLYRILNIIKIPSY